MDSCHSLQCESQTKRIYNEGELEPETSPPRKTGPGVNPIPTFEIDKRTMKYSRREIKNGPKSRRSSS